MGRSRSEWIVYACMWYEWVRALEVPSGGYGGRVLDIFKEGMGRDSSKLQYTLYILFFWSKHGSVGDRACV